jgi:hypothetical protein
MMLKLFRIYLKNVCNLILINAKSKKIKKYFSV